MSKQSVEIIGIHRVKAPQACHLIEIIIRNSNGKIEMSDFTQIIPGKPKSSWQVPYNDMFLNNDGTEITGDVMLDGDEAHFWNGDVRIAFFFHYLDLSKKLETPFSPIKLPSVTKKPERLKIMQYNPVD